MDVKVSKDKHIRRWVIERSSSLLDETEPTPSIKMNKVIDRGKRSKTLKNISKNLQSFLEISPMQKEVHGIIPP